MKIIGGGQLTFLDSGSYNFEEFIKILYGKGFNGYISIEHGDHLGNRDPWEVAFHEIKYLKKLIKKFK
jgi:sugar phosphate isomerase/epimerase